MLSLFQTLGAIVALVTACYVAWGHLVRDRPTAWIEARSALFSATEGRDLFLVLTNPSSRPVELILPAMLADDIEFMLGNTELAAASAFDRGEFGAPWSLVLNPKEAVDAQVLGIGRQKPANTDTEIDFTIRWRPLHVGRIDNTLHARLPLRIRTTIRDLELMQANRS